MTPWVLRIVLATVAVFFLQNTTPGLVEALAFVPQLALQRPWTFVSYMFLHAPGFGHIFFNMLTLFFFGPRVEDRIGGRAFLGLYFTSGIAGALLSIPVGYPIIGASGAIFGVLLAYAWFWPRNQMLIWGIIPIEARYMVLLMTGISLYFGFGGAGGGNVAHFAHLGGFVGGYIFLKLMQRNAGNERFRRQTQPAAPRVETTAGALDRWRRIKRDGLHEVNRDELDRILDKISGSGIASLTPGEREFLDRFSARH
ncbi:MAG TPA: rhomboid family intramembrane serine protease [Gemmatimonadales bacterium]|nr:rhomboid family intramembrane serine protease [Gemmatimonadales bacterium]